MDANNFCGVCEDFRPCDCDEEVLKQCKECLDDTKCVGKSDG